KTIETKPKHRRVENTIKTRKNATQPHTNKNTTKIIQKNKKNTPKNQNTGVSQTKIDGQLTHNCPSIQSLSIFYLFYLFLP
ncbi:hypothetical protein ACMZ8H_01190, partial [Gardnerella pickettii]|uniref:hypothetical protein n=1 Tax=Gardnerella pickettii TaxID=2914924 RepID=UPI0039EE7CC2